MTTATNQTLVGRHIQQFTDLTTSDPTSIFPLSQGDLGSFVTAVRVINDSANPCHVTFSFFNSSINAVIIPQFDTIAGSLTDVFFPAPVFIRYGEEIRADAQFANRLKVWTFGSRNN